MHIVGYIFSVAGALCGMATVNTMLTGEVEAGPAIASIVVTAGLIGAGFVAMTL